MIGQWPRRFAGPILILVLTALVALTPGKAEEHARLAGPVKIGMLGALLKEVPDSLLAAMQQPFSTMMAQQTGLTGELVRSGDAAQLAKELADNKVQLGIFHGTEFAWARQNYPELRPLMICVKKHPELRAFLLVRSDGKTSGIADFQNKVMTLPKRNPHHCVLYFEGICRAHSLSADRFPGKVLYSEDFEESLDQLVEGTADAAVVDTLSLECYQRRKPGRFAKLKVLDKSAAFPCACVAYYAGNGLDDATLKRFKQGMTNANQTYLGKQMFHLFKMTGFAPVPHNYEQNLREIAKAYPAPEAEPASGASKQ